MKWLLALSALLWVPMAWCADDVALQHHASLMGMLNFIGFLILDRLDEQRRA